MASRQTSIVECDVISPIAADQLKHDAEKCAAAFRKDHARTATESAMTIFVALQCPVRSIDARL
jgi:signal recognition particle GTPase